MFVGRRFSSPRNLQSCSQKSFEVLVFIFRWVSSHGTLHRLALVSASCKTRWYVNMCKEAWLCHLLKQLQMWERAHSKAMGLEDGGEPDVHYGIDTRRAQTLPARW